MGGQARLVVRVIVTRFVMPLRLGKMRTPGTPRITSMPVRAPRFTISARVMNVPWPLNFRALNWSSQCDFFCVSDTATVGSACAVAVSGKLARCVFPGLSTAVNVAASKPMRRTLNTTVPGGRPVMRNSPLSPVIARARSDFMSDDFGASQDRCRRCRHAPDERGGRRVAHAEYAVSFACCTGAGCCAPSRVAMAPSEPQAPRTRRLGVIAIGPTLRVVVVPTSARGRNDNTGARVAQ